MYIFDGKKFARHKEDVLAAQLRVLSESGVIQQPLCIVAVLFTEDAGSVLYTRLKKAAAARVGMEYRVVEHSLLDPVAQIVASIRTAAAAGDVTGIIVQKPLKKTWAQQHQIYEYQTAAFQEWWGELVAHIPPEKDSDGLHPATLAQLRSGSGALLPATCAAVISIMEANEEYFDITGKKSQNISIIGRSEILGEPLYYALKQRGALVELLGKAEFELRKASGSHMHASQVIISATGVPDLITGEHISLGTALIDVGAPRGDVQSTSVTNKASFITPVPGGVGPVTVVSLLENTVTLALRQYVR